MSYSHLAPSPRTPSPSGRRPWETPVLQTLSTWETAMIAGSGMDGGGGGESATS